MPRCCRNVSNVKGVPNVKDGVYLEWLPGTGSEGLPAAIVCVEKDSISFHANTSDDRIIRHPLRNTLAQIRGTLVGIEERDDFESRARRELSEYLQSEPAEFHRIEFFSSGSPEGATWGAVAESWWDDFDSILPVVGPRLMAGARLVGPNSWFVVVGRRVNSRNSYTSHPSLQFLVKAASLDEVRGELLNMRDGLVRAMHHLVVASQVESD